MNEVVDKAAVVAEPTKPVATVSSAMNPVPPDLELRVTKAKLALATKLDELKNDGQQDTAVKRDALKARLSELDHHVKGVVDGWANISPAVTAKLETWLAQA